MEGTIVVSTSDLDLDSHLFPSPQLALAYSPADKALVSLLASQGFDEFMNVVLDAAAEISLKGKSERKELGTFSSHPRCPPELNLRAPSSHSCASRRASC